MTLIHGVKDTAVEYKNSKLLFDEYINNNHGFSVTQTPNCFSGMDKATYGQAELYSIRNANHNDIDSVYVRQMRFIMNCLIERVTREGDLNDQDE